MNPLETLLKHEFGHLFAERLPDIYRCPEMDAGKDARFPDGHESLLNAPVRLLVSEHHVRRHREARARTEFIREHRGRRTADAGMA